MRERNGTVPTEQALIICCRFSLGSMNNLKFYDMKFFPADYFRVRQIAKLRKHGRRAPVSGQVSNRKIASTVRETRGNLEPLGSVEIQDNIEVFVFFVIFLCRVRATHNIVLHKYSQHRNSAYNSEIYRI